MSNDTFAHDLLLDASAYPAVGERELFRTAVRIRMAEARARSARLNAEFEANERALNAAEAARDEALGIETDVVRFDLGGECWGGVFCFSSARSL